MGPNQGTAAQYASGCFGWSQSRVQVAYPLKITVRDKMDDVYEREFTIDFERPIQAQDIVLAVMVITSLPSSVQFTFTHRLKSCRLPHNDQLAMAERLP